MYVILDMTLRHSRHVCEAVQPKRGRPEEIPTTANGGGENETVGTSNTIKQEAGSTPRNNVGQRPSIISNMPRPYPTTDPGTVRLYCVAGSSTEPICPFQALAQKARRCVNHR
jgi:hypothetical protein